MIGFLLLSASLMTNFYNVTVIKVNDGDTIKVDIPRMPAVFSPIGVRIKGIDTAEIHDKRACIKKQGMLAKSAMTNLIASGQVDLLFCEPDKYMRLLCSVRIANKFDAATYMLERNLAKPYWGERKKVFSCPR